MKHEDQTHHGCQNAESRVEPHAERYLENTDDEFRGTPSTATLFTCPMHPEVERVGPSDCPITSYTYTQVGV